MSSASRRNMTPGQAVRPVVLGLSGDPVTILGKVKPPLTLPQYRVVRALIVAGEDGLTKSQLDRTSGHCEARKILKRLHDSDPDWATVIHMPGRPGRRYRIC